jgi:sugar phosphate isomerase/epimerase
MRFGICCPAQQAAAAVESGFDYAEVGASDLSDSWPTLKGIPVDATNLFFPGHFRLFAPKVGDAMKHAKLAIESASRLGVRVMVIGSGAQRRAPTVADASQSLEEFIDLVEEIELLAKSRGIAIAPESLTRDETNVANDLPTMAGRLSVRHVGYTADSFHVLRESHYNGVPTDWTKQLPFAPTHVHFADFPRHVPSLEDTDSQGFLRRLKDLNYDSRISFEGSREELNLVETVESLHQLWAAA